MSHIYQKLPHVTPAGLIVFRYVGFVAPDNTDKRRELIDRLTRRDFRTKEFGSFVVRVALTPLVLNGEVIYDDGTREKVYTEQAPRMATGADFGSEVSERAGENTDGDVHHNGSDAAGKPAESSSNPKARGRKAKAGQPEPDGIQGTEGGGSVVSDGP